MCLICVCIVIYCVYCYILCVLLYILCIAIYYVYCYACFILLPSFISVTLSLYPLLSLSCLVQSCPHLIGRPVEVQKLLQRTARPLTVPLGAGRCGQDTNTNVPNNYFGSGELDIDKAIHTCQAEKKQKQ